MTAKEYLSKIQTYRKAVENHALRIEELYHDASGLKAIVYDKERVQVSPENRMEQIFERIDKEAEKYVKARIKYEEEVRKRTDQIAGMDRPEYSEILRLRYIETDRDGRMMSLEEISCRMHRSYNNVKHLHGWALKAFQKRYLS